MIKNKAYSKLMIESQNTDLLHVFFVVNPITVIVTRLIIDTFKIDKENILIISYRGTDLTLLDYRSLKIIPNRLESYFDKLFFTSTSGNRILNELDNKPFLVYCSWADRGLNFLMTAKNCSGHFYIEEGQGTYMLHKPFRYNKTPLLQKFINNFKNRVNNNEESGFFYRDDAIGYIGLSEDSFPTITSTNKIVLSNIETLKKSYNPKLLGIKNIGLTCAERRLENNDWKKMLKKLIKQIPSNSVIKAHPSFTSTEDRFRRLKQNLIEVSNGETTLCSNDVIIELEMLYESKNIFGPQTSLSRYSKHWNSRFKNIKLY